MAAFLTLFVVVTAFQALLVLVPVGLGRMARAEGTRAAKSAELLAPLVFAFALPVALAATIGVMLRTGSSVNSMAAPGGSAAVAYALLAVPCLCVVGYVAGRRIVVDARRARARSRVGHETFE